MTIFDRLLGRRSVLSALWRSVLSARSRPLGRRVRGGEVGENGEVGEKHWWYADEGGGA